MSTTLRFYSLRLLRGVGVKQLRARSGLGRPYVCFLGDFIGENPFYNRETGRAEILLMAAWCRQTPGSYVFDVGGNLGFFATQLAQLTAEADVHIVSFEPAPATFARLVEAVRRLRLEDRVIPICSALSDRSGLVPIAFQETDTMRAHLVASAELAEQGERVAWTSCLTIDEATRSVGAVPALIKIDVEGHEVRVLRGGRELLGSANAPALLVEWNPGALARAGFGTDALACELAGFSCFYVNDFTGQRAPFGKPVSAPQDIDWECNLFAVPATPRSLARCARSFSEAAHELARLRG